ncbi:tetratricopeptide repeat protein [Kroppenstedtia pulmonis]|uniref:Tetratricopeptide repeat protein n=1 Tax=Kroppenstedtia pulmonis TaxID=1380685 RepID=A0A7D3YA17_9BACL|nr:helix-turn-helix domain-containing protein [Kroppenstedtia pulmonis]QKG84621.1 tetratricopeptide repeat protein [Kroppenstedtia pulmonis]
MSLSHVNEVGSIIRKVRRERGLRLEDLADENISPATISNIERGVSHVKQDKVLYLMEKLDVSMENIPYLLLKNKDEMTHIRFQLDTVESLKRLNHLDKALDILKKVNMTEDHPFSSEYYWLKGVCHLFLKKYKKAERDLTNAIRLSHQNDMAKQGNIEAYSFNDLSLCYYYRNDLEQALQYVDSGLDAFHPEGDRKIIKYILTKNKCIYLERLGQTIPALRIVDHIWDELPLIKKSETYLSFYWLKGELLRKCGAYEEAISYAREGMLLASENKQYNLAFDLWTVLGSAYQGLNDWDKAEECFDVALMLAEEHVTDNRLIRGYIQLGELKMCQEKWDEAQNILMKSIEKSKELSTSYLIDANMKMGHLYRKQKKNKQAISYYHMSVELAQKLRLKEKEYQGWYNLAKCWKGVDENEFRQASENMFKVEEEIQ